MPDQQCKFREREINFTSAACVLLCTSSELLFADSITGGGGLQFKYVACVFPTLQRSDYGSIPTFVPLGGDSC